MLRVRDRVEGSVMMLNIAIKETKGPGSDGYISGFNFVIKEAWNCIAPNITSAILDFFQSGKLLKHVNATILCLIPKFEQLIDVT